MKIIQFKLKIIKEENVKQSGTVLEQVFVDHFFTLRSNRRILESF